MRNVKLALTEGLMVGIIGLLLALAANFLSPRGLALTRNYFPGALGPGQSPTNAPVLPAGATNDPAVLLAQAVARLQQKGLQPIDHQRVAELYRDPRYEQECFVIVDARNDQLYQQGHIPRALQFDHYRAETYLPTALPACLTAEIIVVYCNGGNCEDSEFAALTLTQAGVPKERLFVYAAGMTDWAEKGLPVELGARGSGVLRPAKP